MRLLASLSLLLASLSLSSATANTTSISLPLFSNSSSSLLLSRLDPAPIGISFEFFAFPAYFTDVPSTSQCLANWADLNKGIYPPIRIGGTTQDRAQYAANFTDSYVNYTVPNAAAAPATLIFGPRFLELAGVYQGSVVMGLNRGWDVISNTIAAAQDTVKKVGKNLLAIELGNEPDYYYGDGQAIATNGWSPELDAASQNQWDVAVGQALNKTKIIQAGNWNSDVGYWGAFELIPTESPEVKSYVKTYSHHNYPGGSVQSLMSHSNIADNIYEFDDDVTTVQKEGKDYVLGETNSVAGGGAASMSPTFGAALWTLDYSLRAASFNISRIYFHHGTVGNCQYCFWGRYSMGAPYYGATAAVEFLAGASYIAAMDDGTTDQAAYAVYDEAKKPLRLMLVNSEYFSGATSNASRSTWTFELGGLGTATVMAKRLTAPSALSRQDQGGNPTFGGQSYANGTCLVDGELSLESTAVTGQGTASFEVAASEALMLYL